MEAVENQICPRCGQSYLKIYFSDGSNNKVAASCGFCNMKAYFSGEELVAVSI